MNAFNTGYVSMSGQSEDYMLKGAIVLSFYKITGFSGVPDIKLLEAE